MEPDQAPRKIRVLVADSSRIHTQLLANALLPDPELAAMSWDSAASALIPAIVSQKVEILAISSSFGGRAGDGLKIVRELRSTRPQTKIVVLLDVHEETMIIEAFRLGVRGVFSRESSIEMFCKCIRAVDRGEIWVDNRGIAVLVESLASTPILRAMGSPALSLLSRRELEVVQCVIQGMTNREIAAQLGLSQHTVKNYLFRVFDKLGVSSRVELLFMTLRQNGYQEKNVPDRSSLLEVYRQMFDGDSQASDTLALVESAAQEGVPAAQLSLAQALTTRAHGADELVKAYTWYLIVNEQAQQSRADLATLLTSNQIEQAQQQATVWLAQAKPPSALLSTALSGQRNSDLRQSDESASQSTQPPDRAADASRLSDQELRVRSHARGERVLTFGSA